MNRNEKPKIVSLQSRKAHKNKLGRKQYLDTETRIRELEEDMLRVIEMSLYLEHTVQYQEKLIARMIRALADAKGIDTSDMDVGPVS